MRNWQYYLDKIWNGGKLVIIFTVVILIAVSYTHLTLPTNYLNLTLPEAKRIPDKIIIAMADVESASGTSRFATEGNALFGVRTWDPKVPQMKPQAIPNARFGVKKYLDKCQSVGDVIDILNRHPAYKDFRIERDNQIHKTYWNYEKLIPLLAPWSTNPDYGKIILARMKELKL